MHLLHGQLANAPKLFVSEIRLLGVAAAFMMAEVALAGNAPQVAYREANQACGTLLVYISRRRRAHAGSPHTGTPIAGTNAIASSSAATIMAL